MKLILASDLQVGMVILLPFDKTATVTQVRVGRKIVHFRTEYGPARIGLYDEVLIEA